MGRNVTVYIPNDMVELMDRLKEVNWSEVCRRAIAGYLATRSAPNIEAVLTRLKDERGQEYSRGYKLATELGRELPYRELARLVEGWEEKRDELESKQHEERVMPIYAIAREWRSYWTAAIPGPYRDATEDFIKGFENALVELYKEVRGESLRSLLT